MWNDTEEFVFDCLRSKLREMLGVNPPCETTALQRHPFTFGDYGPNLFESVCRFMVEYLLSEAPLDESETADFCETNASDGSFFCRTRLVRQPTRSRQLIERLYDFYDRDIYFHDRENEIFTLVLDQIANGTATVQAAALAVVCPRMIPEDVWFYPFLQVRTRQIMPSISLALRATDLLVLERAVFAWETFCASNPKNFKLDDYFRILEIWENPNNKSIEAVVSQAIALVTASVSYKIAKPPLLTRSQRSLMWNETVETMVRLLSDNSDRHFCCCVRFLSILELTLFYAPVEARIQELVRRLVSHTKAVHGADVSADSLFQLSSFSEIREKELAFFGSRELRDFLRPYHRFGAVFNSISGKVCRYW